MKTKIKQLNILININEQKYRSLMSDYNLNLNSYNTSISEIASIERNLDKNSYELADLMTNYGGDVIEKYQIINDYIKTLFVELQIKEKESLDFKNEVDMLSKKLMSIKVESKGYDILVEKHEDEIVKNIRNSEAKELDEIWLLKRSRI